MSIQPNRDNGSPITHVYIAGPYGSRDAIKTFAERIWESGFVVTSRWHDGPKTDPSKRDRKIDQRVSAQNWHDLLNSDVIIAFSAPEARGTLAEIGAGIALSKLVIEIGDPRTVTLMVDRPGSTFWAADEDEAIDMLTVAENDPDPDEDDDNSE